MSWGGLLHHQVTGPPEAPVIVLSNSLGTDTRLWDLQVDALSERLRVVRYDHRGHGRSPVPRGPYALQDLSRDVLRLLDHLGVARASLCGVSLGGMVGIWLGAYAPERIERLVLCCTSAHLPPGDAWVERARAVRAAGSTAVVADAVLARWLTADGLDEDPVRAAALRSMLVATPAEGYAGCCEAISRLDLRDALGRIVAPTLAIAGADDPATPPEHLRAIANGILGARLEVLEGAAHLANLERPDALTALVLEHCAAPEVDRA
ncbi:Beta-ketoadipate enol-lactone hydrolase [Patulibacter medicamentivorans]|uniref:Beta-ketoadipate enol-lactone hydrolase n=1 Tax=Patulibacter medicamentivorans TaxID=1097667 RepID=H0E807_9ACTN|nr:3-oxoadipate enol-lactonase [Patulibacter medicamentivorans]EHN10205.1 Beta-ketoadipate enol-lactone hydrolase [Patulibacter medicamentivorans]